MRRIVNSCSKWWSWVTSLAEGACGCQGLSSPYNGKDCIIMLAMLLAGSKHSVSKGAVTEGRGIWGVFF